MAPPHSAPRVTLVIITRNRRADLEHSLGRHETPVIVVDNGSSDGTADLVRDRFPDVELVALRTNLGAVARNLGVERARTPYVAFADDDSWWAPGALDLAADRLDAHPRLGLLAARMLVGAEQAPDPICQQMSRAPLGTSPDLPGPNVLGFLACGAVVRRDAFLAAGGFDEVVFFAGEEERLALDLAALGWGLAYVEEVVAHHHPSTVRHSPHREVRAVRNRILTALMRRPWSAVVRTVLTAARSGPDGRAGVREAVGRVPMALSLRRPLPARIEVARRLVDRVG